MQTAYKSIRLFENPFFEWFSHIHPITPLLVWGPVAGWCIYQGLAVDGLSALATLALGAGGFLVWTLAEYVLHRFVFHFSPKGNFQTRLQFIMHGIHHTDPMDPTRLVMAPIVALMLAVIFYALFRVTLGPAYVHPFFGFFILGYLVYDYTHFAVHHFTPRTRWGKTLKQSHMSHHYVNHDLRWGVSSPLWDWVFGTYREPIPVKKPKSRPTGMVESSAASSKSAKSGKRRVAARTRLKVNGT